MSVSVIIPVKNGEEYLAELLSALESEAPDEVLVIDSGSQDASVEIARRFGVTVLEIPPEEFGHGRTRNFGAERTSGDLICFLTQDATPLRGWLTSYREAFALAPRVGAAYGPHVPRADASPMIARELEEFFASFSLGGGPVVQQQGDPTFLSNVNACYSRACWEQLGFRNVAYAEDQAFGADLLDAGWSKVYHPGASVLHSHDYGFVDFMRRYFDEYRGLRETTGHIEPFAPRDMVGHIQRSVRGDMQWLVRRGAAPGELANWSLRSAAHHGGRRVFSAVGSRSHRLPAAARGRLSLERRDGTPPIAQPGAGADDAAIAGFSPLRGARTVGAGAEHELYAEAARVWRDGPAPLLEPIEGTSERRRLRIAMVIPGFGRGSGGHALLFQIFSRLERRGHIGSVWVHDYFGGLRHVPGGQLRRDINQFFTPIAGPVYSGFDDWRGADVVLATGWQTAHPVLLLDRCFVRVYVVNDHEPEFYATSAESACSLRTRIVTACTAWRGAPGFGISWWSVTTPRLKRSSMVSTTPSISRDRWRAVATQSSITRDRKHLAARFLSGCWRSRSCTSGAPMSASSCSEAFSRLKPRSRTWNLAFWIRLSSHGSTRRRPSGCLCQ